MEAGALKSNKCQRVNPGPPRRGNLKHCRTKQNISISEFYIYCPIIKKIKRLKPSVRSSHIMAFYRVIEIRGGIEGSKLSIYRMVIRSRAVIPSVAIPNKNRQINIHISALCACIPWLTLQWDIKVSKPVKRKLQKKTFIPYTPRCK